LPDALASYQKGGIALRRQCPTKDAETALDAKVYAR
jgi:hypothetical protein